MSYEWIKFEHEKDVPLDKVGLIVYNGKIEAVRLQKTGPEFYEAIFDSLSGDDIDANLITHFMFPELPEGEPQK